MKRYRLELATGATRPLRTSSLRASWALAGLNNVSFGTFILLSVAFAVGCQLFIPDFAQAQGDPGAVRYSPPGLDLDPGMSGSSPGFYPGGSGMGVPGIPGMSASGLGYGGMSNPGMNVPGMNIPGMNVPGMNVPGMNNPGM